MKTKTKQCQSLEMADRNIRWHRVTVKQIRRMETLRARARDLYAREHELELAIIARLQKVGLLRVQMDDGRMAEIHDNFQNADGTLRNVAYRVARIKHREIAFRLTKRSKVRRLG